MAGRDGHFDGPERSGGALRPEARTTGSDPAAAGPRQAVAGLPVQVLGVTGGAGPPSVAVLDEHDDIFPTTPAWDQLFGYETGGLVGVPVHRLLSPPTAPSPSPRNDSPAGQPTAACYRSGAIDTTAPGSRSRRSSA